MKIKHLYKKISFFKGMKYSLLNNKNITISNNITSHMNQAAELESQVTELKASNSALEGRIASSTNLGVVKQAAINDLGMVYANTDQIVYYSIDDTDSMSQYKAIP